MKRFFLFSLAGLVLSILIFLPLAFSQTNETLTISTYYPSPYGVYNELRLYPKPSADCLGPNDEGKMYYNSALKQLMVCKGTGGIPPYDWEYVGSLWTLNAPNLYPNNPAWNVGIGTTGPVAYKLQVIGDVGWSGTLQTGSVPWGRLTSFPSSCPAGQYVTAVGGTLTCSTPPGGGSGGNITISAPGGSATDSSFTFAGNVTYSGGSTFTFGGGGGGGGGPTSGQRFTAIAPQKTTTNTPMGIWAFCSLVYHEISESGGNTNQQCDVQGTLNGSWNLMAKAGNQEGASCAAYCVKW